MKHFFSFLLVIVLASCTAPKYAYRFPSSNTFPPTDKKVAAELYSTETSEEKITDQVASSDPNSFLDLPTQKIESPVVMKNDPLPRRTIRAIKKSAQKTMEELRSVVVPDPASLDEDLKLAILFGVVGMVSLVLLILSKLFGIIGGIALIVATIYFVKWFLAQ